MPSRSTAKQGQQPCASKVGKLMFVKTEELSVTQRPTPVAEAFSQESGCLAALCAGYGMQQG